MSRMLRPPRCSTKHGASEGGRTCAHEEALVQQADKGDLHLWQKASEGSPAFAVRRKGLEVDA